MKTHGFMKHAGIAVTFILSVGLFLGGCGANTNATSSDTNTISVNNIEPAAGLIPSDTNDMAGWKIVTQLFEGLVTFSDTGKLVYADAQSITPNSDASQYTIKLRDGLKFSNGENITAQTYAKSWSFAANAANGQMGAAIFATIKGYDDIQDEQGDTNAQLSGLEAVDDTTLNVTLSAPDSSFPYKVGDIAFLPLPQEAYKNIKAFGERPIGNGPYTLSSWEHDQNIVLKPNPTYDGPRKAQNAGITFKLYTNLDSAYADLQSGNLDVLDTIPNSALQTYTKEANLQTVNTPGPGFKSFTIAQNLKHFTGEEGRLRRAAISMAINRDNIVAKVLHDTATTATDFTAPPIAGYSKNLDGSQVLAYNAKQAKALWKQADGISPWDGTFQLAYSADSGNKQLVEAIMNSVKNVLDIDAEPYAFPTQKELSGAIHERTVNAAFLQGLQSDYPHPEGYLVQAYDSSAADGKGLNNGDYKSSAFDGLIDQAASQTDLEASIAYYHQAEELLLKDLPVIPLWYANVNAAAGITIKKPTFNYMGVPDYPSITKR